MANQTYFNIIIGKETIVNTIRVLPIGGRWALLTNGSYWILVSKDICEFSKIYDYALDNKGTLNSLQQGL